MCKYRHTYMCIYLYTDVCVHTCLYIYTLPPSCTHALCLNCLGSSSCPYNSFQSPLFLAICEVRERTNMFFYASTKCSFTVTFTNDAVAVTSVFTMLVILTGLVASVIPTQLLLYFPLSYNVRIKTFLSTLFLWLLFTLFYTSPTCKNKCINC